MSNHLAIATVTATLQRTLQTAVQGDVEGARVTTVRPSDIGNGTPETGVNVFLYQIITNPALTNMDAAPIRAKGNPGKRQAALDLFYMLSFYGNESELAPQRLLGSVVSTLTDLRSIPATLIQDTCDDSTLSFLRDSNLGDQVQQLNVIPMDLSLEDLSKTWTVFFQTPYVLSIAYKVMVLMLEGEVPFQRALPIRERQTGGTTPYFKQPTVERVIAAEGRLAPIHTTSDIKIQGQFLKGRDGQGPAQRGHQTLVRIGDREIIPSTVTDTEITLSLTSLPASALRAGVQSLQVLHPPTAGSLPPGAPGYGLGVESNAAPFVLRPTLDAIAVELNATDEDEPRAGQVSLQINLPVYPEQRVVLFLNEWSVTTPQSYLFDKADPRTEPTQTITVPIHHIQPGEYLVRIHVDGAESQLVVDDTPGSPTENWFIGPRLTIP
ncbi:DUF4255 domain-containing protein [Leptolyngbya sp. PCC 6406]|uniref:DUF4255 domain-containing protein n=1 Tax=Leptolyngbya sp. PCC 6406 TaxID=1173264 RepID=UPI0002AD0DE4|nr:DUF4255 domain-containing protein [Leptolyngbya sp. PCC 6406]